MTKLYSLLDMKPGQSATINSVETSMASLKERLEAVGFTSGEKVTFLRKAPFGDPLEIELMNTRLCIRKNEAAIISVQGIFNNA